MARALTTPLPNASIVNKQQSGSHWKEISTREHAPAHRTYCPSEVIAANEDVLQKVWNSERWTPNYDPLNDTEAYLARHPRTLKKSLREGFESAAGGSDATCEPRFKRMLVRRGNLPGTRISQDSVSPQSIFFFEREQFCPTMIVTSKQFSRW